MTMPLSKTSSTLAVSLLCLGLLAHAQSGKRLWVLQEPNAIAEYDPTTFALRSSHQVPAEIFQSPQDLQINAKGQMLFLPATVREPDGLVHESSNPRVWFWDGSSAKVLSRTITNKHVPSGKNVLVSSARPRCFLSANGAHLFWFENRFKTLKAPDTEQEISTNATFHAWQTDLAGKHPEDIATYKFPPCRCETAFCTETCPEASYWPPENGIDDHFITTTWIPGQIESRYEASFLYRKSADRWSRTKLPHPVKQVLYSSSDGSGLVLIEAIPDGGCCGWVNESDDQALLTRKGRTVVLFDEFRQYQNQDYGVSFFPADAKLSPHSRLAALTVTAEHRPGSEIPLSEGGKANAAELSRIQQALAELPVVEVLRLDDPPKRTAVVPHASLVGWVNDQEVLLIEKGRLVSYNVVNGRRRESDIKVGKESYAFLR